MFQDPHWSLFTDHCSPCLSNYTYIVHLEKEKEEEAVLNITGLQKLVPSTRWMNPTRGGASEKYIEEFARNLSCDSLKGLYQRYWPDLLLFQYSMDKIFEFGDEGKGCEIDKS